MHKGLEWRRDWLVRDAINVLWYGRHAPRWCELIWVDPQRVAGNPFPKAPGYLKRDSARVVDHWPDDAPDITDDLRIRECLDRWVHGMTWEETGRIDAWEAHIVAHGVVYGCRVT